MSGARRCICLALALAGLVAPAAEAAKAPSGFFGVQAWQEPFAYEFQRMGQGKATVFRFNLLWSQVEPSPGARNWGIYDRIFANSARGGVRLLPVLVGSPSFAAKRTQWPPKSSKRKAFAAFAKEAVARYGRRGSFWAQSGLPNKAPRAWQVWNEPNVRAYWNNKPNARQYAILLKLIRKAVKSKDSKAKLVTGGLPDTNFGIKAAKYLKALYKVKGVKKQFDAVAIHPYAKDHKGVEGSARRARAIMDRMKDKKKQIWLTEIGWAVSGPQRNKAFVAGVEGQAKRLKSTFNLALRKRRKLKIGAVVWFAWRDRRLVPGERDWWAPHTGFFDLHNRPRPAWSTFTGFTGGRP